MVLPPPFLRAVLPFICAASLPGEWGYEGYVISDVSRHGLHPQSPWRTPTAAVSQHVFGQCDTIGAISSSFHYTASVEQATAIAVKAGGDINCGPEYVLGPGGVTILNSNALTPPGAPATPGTPSSSTQPSTASSPRPSWTSASGG